MTDKKHPTEGGSYIRSENGDLEKIEATKPALAPHEVEKPAPETPAGANHEGQ